MTKVSEYYMVRIFVFALVGGVMYAQPAFEVAAIKPPNPESRLARPTISSGRLTGESVSLRNFIEEAYGILPVQLTNVPGWVDSGKWSIQAKGDDKATPAEVRAMLRTLLAERFHLKLHADKKEQSYVALQVKDTSRVSKSLAEAEPGKPPVRTTLVGERVSTKFSNYTMFAFVRVLSTEVERMVVDETGLTGSYDFGFESFREPNEPNSLSRIAPIIGDVGLRLDSRKGLVDVWVIDSVERPSEN